MLRRRAGGFYGHSNYALFCSSQLSPRRHGLLDNFIKLSKGIGTGQMGRGEPQSSDRASSSPKDGFPPGLGPENLRTIQDLFNKQPPERQKQLMKQALEFQKTIGKIPGFRKVAEQGVQTMEVLLKQQSVDRKGDPLPGSILSSSEVGNHVQRQFVAQAVDQQRDTVLRPSPSASSGSRGLTLDDLKKVNLGPEIEALFEELRSIREKKNHYRELYNKTKVMLESELKEKNELASSLNRVRGRLKQAEHEVMLLNSECMDAQEAASKVKLLTKENRLLSEELKEIKALAKSPAGPSYEDLQRRLYAKDEALYSLQRKVERIRRRDPLLGLSMVCSDISRLCDPAHDPLKGIAEEAFNVLQDNYLKQQQEVWAVAARDNNGAAAKAYVAVVKRFFSSRIPHYNYDAIMVVEGDTQALKGTVQSMGFVMSPVADRDRRWMLTAQADAAPLTASLGPYAYAFALWTLSATGSGNSSNNSNNSNFTDNDYTSSTSVPISLPLAELPYTVTHVVPCVSTTLVVNKNRTSIEYEAARASGPGGQATNVTETQIHAKLLIDGMSAFSAQAQDSRSALQNKESAIEKLMAQRRQQYNESLSKRLRAEEVQKNVLAAMAAVGTWTFATTAAEASALECVQEAVKAGFVCNADMALVQCFGILKRKLTKSSETSG